MGGSSDFQHCKDGVGEVWEGVQQRGMNKLLVGELGTRTLDQRPVELYGRIASFLPGKLPVLYDSFKSSLKCFREDSVWEGNTLHDFVGVGCKHLHKPLLVAFLGQFVQSFEDESYSLHAKDVA